MDAACSVLCELGESPIWSSGCLFWVDILGKSLKCLHPNGAVSAQDLAQMPGAVAPRRSGGLVGALHHGFALIDGGHLHPLLDPQPHTPPTRFNDGKCDAWGRFWAGTMGMMGAKRAGALYRLDPDRTVHIMLRDIGCSNGLAWDAVGEHMYYIDSSTGCVEVFDFDGASGQISGRRVLVNFAGEGIPDGMTIDAEGNLWVALWGGGKVVCHDAENGARLTEIELPVSQVTSCTFGGAELDVLYVTSARVGLDAQALKEQPLAGATFHTKPGVRGLPAAAWSG